MLVTIVVAVGIVGDEMHEVAPLEKTLLVENERGTVVFQEQPKVQINAIDLTDHITAAATLWPHLHQPPPHRAKAHPDAMPSRHLYRLSQTTSPLQLPHHFATHRLVAPSPSTSTTSTSPRESPPRCHAVATRKTPADDDELGFRLARGPISLNPHHYQYPAARNPRPDTMPSRRWHPQHDSQAPTHRQRHHPRDYTLSPDPCATPPSRWRATHKTPPPAITTRPPLYHTGPPRATTASNSDDDGATGDSGRDGKALVPETMYLIMQ
ncbi:hypothetical protein EDB89DRAFT_1914709 [Lactarius sanguifluus]|nr:hypothetical protein EDB89DRAFT_1914709 [Lactarius sanguifluus]